MIRDSIMTKKILYIALTLLISSCATGPIPHPKHSFLANLSNQTNGGQQCSIVKPHLEITTGNDEVLTIKFKTTLKILDISPEGNKKVNKSVFWSKLASDNKTRIALLTKPNKLKVGNIKSYVEKSICIEFKPELSNEKNEFKDIHRLAGATCCGQLFMN